MIQLIFIATGGAVGALARYCLTNAIYAALGQEFPYGTLIVNVLGSLCMGFLYVLMIERSHVSAEWRGALIVGLLGAFTTFSAFSIETFNLLDAGEHLKATMNIVLSITLCLAACWLGIILGRNL